MRAKLDQDVIPHEVQAVASALRSAAGRAFLVGGPIRDLLLKKEPEDWDIATNLSPREVLAVFPSAVTVGIEFGRVQVGDVDVVSLRAESGYLDGRHPSSVSFGVPVEEDLRRRDFTVNAMAAEFPGLEVIDPFGGTDDLTRGVLRAVGDARTRLAEDPLRILRAVRFKAVLGMSMDSSVSTLLPEMAGSLSGISGERTFAELRRLLLAPGVHQGILDLRDYGLGQAVLPEVFLVDREALEALARALAVSPPDLPTRLALLFSTAGRCMAKQALVRFNVESAVRQDVDWVLANAETGGQRRRLTGGGSDLGYEVRKLVDSGGLENVRRLVDFEQALWRSQGKCGFAPETEALAAGMALAKDRMIGPLALTGDDVMRVIEAAGPVVGDALRYLRDLVLRDPSANEMETLENALREWWGKR